MNLNETLSPMAQREAWVTSGAHLGLIRDALENVEEGLCVLDREWQFV